jgi:hypothetical protein
VFMAQTKLPADRYASAEAFAITLLNTDWT